METFLLDYAGWIRHATLFSWVGQNIMWFLTKVFYTVSAACESLVDNVFQVYGFLDYPVVTSIYTILRGVSFWILVVMSGVYGLQMIRNTKLKLKDATFNLILYACLIVQLPALTSWGFEVAHTIFVDSNQLVTEQGAASESLSFNIIQANTADLVYVATQDKGFGLLDDPSLAKNGMTASEFSQIDLTTILDPKDIDDLQGRSQHTDTENLKYYLVGGENGSEVTAKEIKNGWFSFFKEGTFRYAGNFKVMLISFLILIIYNLLLFSKLIFIMIDLVFQILSFPIVAFTDLQTGERAKKVLMMIFTSLLTISLLGFSRALFAIYYQFIDTLEYNFVGYFILGLCGAIGFLKGSDSIARAFGVNTSMKDGLATAAGLYGLYRGGKAVGGAAKAGAEKVSEGVKQVPEMARKSVRQTTEAAGKAAHAIGATAGHISESGVGGFAVDTLQTTANQVKVGVASKADQAKDAVKQPLQETKQAYEDGVAGGVATGISARTAREKPKEPTTSAPTTPVHTGPTSSPHTENVKVDDKGNPIVSADKKPTPQPEPKPTTPPSSVRGTGPEVRETTPTTPDGTTKPPTPTGQPPERKQAPTVPTNELPVGTTANTSNGTSAQSPRAPEKSTSQSERQLEQTIQERVTTRTQPDTPPTAPTSVGQSPASQTVNTKQNRQVNVETTTRTNEQSVGTTSVGTTPSTGFQSTTSTEHHQATKNVVIDYQTKLEQARGQGPSKYKDLYRDTPTPPKGEN